VTRPFVGIVLCKWILPYVACCEVFLGHLTVYIQYSMRTHSPPPSRYPCLVVVCMGTGGGGGDPSLPYMYSTVQYSTVCIALIGAGRQYTHCLYMQMRLPKIDISTHVLPGSQNRSGATWAGGGREGEIFTYEPWALESPHPPPPRTYTQNTLLRST
jgi:hypothetical protein